MKPIMIRTMSTLALSALLLGGACNGADDTADNQVTAKAPAGTSVTREQLALTTPERAVPGEHYTDAEFEALLKAKQAFAKAHPERAVDHIPQIPTLPSAGVTK